jgi:hypothetical protein
VGGKEEGLELVWKDRGDAPPFLGRAATEKRATTTVAITATVQTRVLQGARAILESFFMCSGGLCCQRGLSCSVDVNKYSVSVTQRQGCAKLTSYQIKRLLLGK